MMPGHPPLMKITYDLPEGDFTQVPNDLLSCQYLNPNDKITWMRLASLCRNGESHSSIRTRGDIARALGINFKTLESGLRRLKKNGGLAIEGDEIVLTIPTGPAPEPTISDEIDEQPKRKHSMTQKEAWELVKKGWNKNKPEAWMRLDGPLNTPLMIALETQTKRLEIEREHYEDFTGQVCRGGGADEWWAKQTMKASSVFGFGKVSDKKFENVEKLYKLGARVEKKVDYQDDAEVLARYAVYGYERPRIERIQVKDYDEAARIAVDHNPEDAFVLYFVPNKEKPVFWTGIYTDRTRYLFS